MPTPKSPSAVHSQQDGSGGPGMAQCPLSVVCHGSPRPSQVLWQVPGTVFDQSHPWLQKGRPLHGASQQDPWRGIRPGRQGLHSLPRAWRPPNILRSRREENEAHAGRFNQSKPSEQPAAPEVTEQKGYLLIRDLWQQGTDIVHDMCVVNTDALTFP